MLTTQICHFDDFLFWECFPTKDISKNAALLDLEKFPEDVSQYDDGETLLILKDTFPNLRTSNSNLCSSWISSDAEVSYQRLRCGARIKEHARFHEMGKLLANSGHEDSILMMDENILDGNMAHKLLEEAPRYLQEDWFEEFPEHLRPSKICLVLGGLGARSELHLDPLSWTGWNCFLDFGIYESAIFGSLVRYFLQGKRTT